MARRLSEINFFFLCVGLISILALSPLLFALWFKTPAETFFTMPFNYVPDFYNNVSWMKDGAEGKFLITWRFSPEKFARQPAYLFWPLSGWLVSRLDLNLFVGYTLIRIFLALVKFGALYFFLSAIFKKAAQRQLAFFLALFLPSFYYLSPLRQILPFVTSPDLLARAFFLPHDSLAVSFLLVSAVFFNQGLREKRNQLIFWAALVILPVAILNPAMLSFYYLFFGLAVVLFWFRQKLAWHWLVPRAGLVFGVGLPLIFYYRHLFTTALPFAWIYDQAKAIHWDINLLAYTLKIGPGTFLFPFALPIFWRRKDFLSKLIISWAVLPFLLLPLMGKQLPLSVERLFEMSHYLPLAVLTASSFGWLKKKLARPIIFQKLALTAFVVLALPAFYLSWQAQMRIYSQPFFNVFVPQSTVAAMEWLDQNTPDESVVAAGYFTGGMIPAFAHNRVLFGHDSSTYLASQKLEEMRFIFAKDSPPAEVAVLLKKHRIAYLFFNWETPTFDQINLPQAANLKLVFQNEGNTIYQVVD